MSSAMTGTAGVELFPRGGGLIGGLAPGSGWAGGRSQRCGALSCGSSDHREESRPRCHRRWVPRAVGATGGGCHGRWVPRAVVQVRRAFRAPPRLWAKVPERSAKSSPRQGGRVAGRPRGETNNPPFRRRFLGHFDDEFHQRCLAVARGPVSPNTTLASHERVPAIHRAAWSPRCARWRVSSSLAWTGSSTPWVAVIDPLGGGHAWEPHRCGRPTVRSGRTCAVRVLVCAGGGSLGLSRGLVPKGGLGAYGR